MKTLLATLAILAALIVPGAAFAQSTPAPTHTECKPRIHVEDGDAVFTLADLSQYTQVEQVGHYLYVWVEQDDGSLGPLRNEISGPEFGIIRVRFDERDSDRWFHYRQGSYARKTLLDYVSPTTGEWFKDYTFPFRCVTEGKMRVPVQ